MGGGGGISQINQTLNIICVVTIFRPVGYERVYLPKGADTPFHIQGGFPTPLYSAAVLFSLGLLECGSDVSEEGEDDSKEVHWPRTSELRTQ